MSFEFEELIFEAWNKVIAFETCLQSFFADYIALENLV